MKNIIVIISLVLQAYQISAQQTFEWGVRAGGANTDIINDICNIGNDIYLTGKFSGSFSSGKETVNGHLNKDIYLLKLNRKGDTKWLRTLAGEGANNASQIASSEKQIVLGGVVSETVSQGKKQFKGEGKAVFISSWTDQGKIDWLTRLSYTGHATLDVLEVNPNGSLIFGGLLQGTLNIEGEQLSSLNAKRAYIISMSSEGKPLKSRLTSGEGSHRLVSAAFDKEGNQYLLFSVSGNFSLEKDSMITLSKNVKNALILNKVSKNKKVKWTRTVSGTAYIEGVKVITGQNNQVVVCSNFNKEIKSGETRLTTNSQLKSAIFCFSDSGKLEWAKTISSPVKARSMDILITRNKNILVSGYFRQSYMFNKNEFFSESPDGDIFLLQFNTKGELIWHDEPGQHAANFCKAFTIDQSGNIIFAGGFKNELTLDNEKLKSVGQEDVLVAKYFNCQQKKAIITGNDPLCEDNQTLLSVSGDFTSFLWNDNNWGENEFIVTQPGIYHVTAFDQKGCAASDTVDVLSALVPSLGLPKSIDIYKGEKTYLTANEGFSSYLWDDGLQNMEREVFYQSKIDSMKLQVEAETFNGCSTSDSVMVRFIHSNSIFSSFASVAKAWPNPVQEQLMWNASIKKPEDVSVTLTDGKSVAIFTESISRYIPGSVRTINMTGLASGNYLLSIKVGDALYNQKIVKK